MSNYSVVKGGDAWVWTVCRFYNFLTFFLHSTSKKSEKDWISLKILEFTPGFSKLYNFLEMFVKIDIYNAQYLNLQLHPNPTNQAKNGQIYNLPKGPPRPRIDVINF